MSFRLSIEDGRFARVLEVRGPDLVVGSSEKCGLRLEAPGVARVHAVFRQIGRALVVEAVGRKGTISVAGRVRRRGLARAGDEVRVGDAIVRVVALTPAAPGDAPPRTHAKPPRRAGAAVTASVALHVLVLLAVQGVVLFAGAPPTVSAHIEVDAIEVPVEIEAEPDLVAVEETIDPADMPREEVELLPVEEDLPPLPLIADDPRLRPPEKREAAPRPDDPVPAVPERRPAMGLGADSQLGDRSFGKGEAGTANRTTAGLLEADASGGAVLRGLRGGASRDTVWVIRGDYDQAEKVLTTLAVEHALLGKDALETREIPSTVRALLYNCTGRPLSVEAQRRIAAWVAAGGWLLTTDWGVERLLERGLPGTLTPLRVDERPILTRDEVVDVHPTSDRGLAAGTPQDVGARWWLEDSSVPFTIATGLDAEVLVLSNDLRRRHGDAAGAVAATFSYGSGRVLHLLGHVYQQEGNLRGALLVHRLTVNFLAGAVRR